MGHLPLHPVDDALHDGLIGPGWGGAGHGVGHELATSMLHEAGFTSVDIKDVEDDPFNSYYVCRT